MAKNKEGIEQPNMINSKKYLEGYEQIEWRKKGTYCFDCGREFDVDRLRGYYEDGHAYCLPECNFN